MSLKRLPHLLHEKGTNRIAVRTRLLYFLIPAVTVVTILGIGRAISNDIADDSSRRLARQYSIEAASNFKVSTSPHFILMQQMSRSTTISRWLANENDLTARNMAFEEIMGYAVFAPQAYVMFTVYETLNGYNFEIGLTPEGFTSWGHLRYGHYASQWFFDTRDAEASFILNVQRTRPDEYGRWRLYIWSNNRMYYQGRFVGVVTVGTPFEDVFYATFGGFCVYTKRGYIIDQNGRVRADSAQVLEVIESGIAVHPALPEAADDYNPNLAESINKHLQRMSGGIFQIGVDALEAIPLPVGIYRYASIAPIIGTDWSVVVLSNHLGAFGGTRYQPLIGIAISVFVLSVLIGNMVMRRMAFIPLYKLTQSTAAASDTSANPVPLFGLNRNDEIGYLARTVQSMRDNLNSANAVLKENERVIIQTQEVLKHRERLLSTLNQAAEILLTANENNTMEALMAAMEIVGRCLDVDCVQIWRNETADGELYFVMRYEWLSDLGKEKSDAPIGMRIPDNIKSRWLEIFLRSECINGPVSNFSPQEMAFMNYYNVVSTAMLPLFLDGEFFGFFSVGDCRRERVFTDDEMNMLASAGLMFINVFNRNLQRDMAFTDALTGVRNRRYLMEAADRELRNCVERNFDFSIIMIDLDHFKSVNDRYGHAIGDAVLKIFTARASHALKHDTLLARTGGEEFIVTLPGVAHENAIKTAWRIQATLEAYAFWIEDLVEINVTASFGVASKAENCTTLADILEDADKALYEAKRTGRNTVIGYENINPVASV